MTVVTRSAGGPALDKDHECAEHGEVIRKVRKSPSQYPPPPVLLGGILAMLRELGGVQGVHCTVFSPTSERPGFLAVK